MKQINYNDYINTIECEDTIKFVQQMARYLYPDLNDNKNHMIYINPISKAENKVKQEEVKEFIAAYMAYLDLFDVQKDYVYQIKFNKPDRYQIANNIRKTHIIDVYKKYYHIFNPVNCDLRLLTPEDIIQATIKDIDKSDSYHQLEHVYYAINKEQLVLLKDLLGLGDIRKEEATKRTIGKFVVNNYQSNTLNLLKCATSNYELLKLCKDEMKDISTAPEDLKFLALLLAIFKYDNNPQDNYDEKKIIVNYLEECGLTFEKIRSLTGSSYKFEPRDVSIYDVYNLYDFMHKDNNIDYTRSITVNYIVSLLLSGKTSNTAIIKEVLNKLHINEDIGTKFKDEIQSKIEFCSKHTVNELFNKITSEDKDYIIYLSKLYGILNGYYKKGLLDKDIVSSPKDVTILSILLGSYSYDNKLVNYFKDKGIELDNIYQVIGINKISDEEINNREQDDQDILHFYTLFTNKIFYSTKKWLVNHILNRGSTKSSLVHLIYLKCAKENLKSNGNDQVDEFFENKEKQRKRELEDKLLSNFSLDVYNYLGVLCDYYKDFKDDYKDGDKESLAIFASALKYSPLIKSFFEDKGLTKDRVFGNLHFDNNYYNNEIDIDLIKEHFYNTYLINYSNEPLTVEEILSNAFKFNITFDFTKFFYELGIDIKSKEDLLTQLKVYKEAFFKAQERERIEDIYDHLSSNVKKCVDTVLRIHEYLSNNMDKLKIVKNEDDIKELSIIIGLFSTDKEYIPYFIQNGLSLNVILNRVGLTMNDINNCAAIPINKSLLLDYAHYFESGSTTYMDKIVRSLFSDKVNQSQVLEMITSSINRNYMVLKDEVINQREKKITPQEGIRMLSEGGIPAFDPSNMLTIASFGEELSIHSKIISEIFGELVSSDITQTSVNNINEMVDSAAIGKTKKRSFLSIFKHKEEPQYDHEQLSTFKEKVEDNRNNLYHELIGYDMLRQYIEKYILKLNEYLQALIDYKEFINKQLENGTDELNGFITSLQYDTLLKIIDNKINTFESSIALMKQELMKVHMIIYSHNRVISSLDTSTNVILPLVGVEASMIIGNNTEKKSQAVTGELISLFKNVINQNVLGIQDDLKKLKSSSFDSDKLDYLSISMNNYIDSNSDNSKKR